MKIVTLLALILTLSSCSFSNTNKEEVGVQHDDLEFAVDTLVDQPENKELKAEEGKVAESVIPDEYQAPPVQEEVAMDAPKEPGFSEFKQPDKKLEEFLAESPVAEKVKEAPARINIESDSSFSIDGPTEKYKVQKGETLMLIAFKIYGDYHKWKDIKGWNKNIKQVTEGAELNYVAPAQKFTWAPIGLPHLVKTGDTLGTISMDKYGTPKKWKSIYENNRPLIKNPNLIFAGFTIFYQPERSLASEPK